MKKDGIPKSVSDLVYKDYGEKYLDDADYVAFFWGGIDRDDIDKLFNVVDKALGKSANKLTDKDFKKLHMDDNENAESQDDTEEDTEEEIEVDEEIPDVADEEEPEEEQDSQGDEKDEEHEEIDDETSDDEDELNEDDISIDIDDTVKEKPSIPTAYFFLKITSK